MKLTPLRGILLNGVKALNSLNTLLFRKTTPFVIREDIRKLLEVKKIELTLIIVVNRLAQFNRYINFKLKLKLIKRLGIIKKVKIKFFRHTAITYFIVDSLFIDFYGQLFYAKYL